MIVTSLAYTDLICAVVIIVAAVITIIKNRQGCRHRFVYAMMAFTIGFGVVKILDFLLIVFPNTYVVGDKTYELPYSRLVEPYLFVNHVMYLQFWCFSVQYFESANRIY
jgi:O-antigen ligase